MIHIERIRSILAEWSEFEEAHREQDVKQMNVVGIHLRRNEFRKDIILMAYSAGRTENDMWYGLMLLGTAPIITYQRTFDRCFAVQGELSCHV